ncbi:oligosaccharide flippase family protein [Pseudolactococcus yaeyamensis]
MVNNTTNQSIGKKTLIYFIGNFGSKMIGTLIIPIYAIYLTASEVGQYDFQITIAQFLSPILVLAIWEGLLRFAISDEKEQVDDILSTTLLFSIILLLVSTLILSLVYSSTIVSVGKEWFLYVLMIVLTPLVSIFQYMTRSLKMNIIYMQSGIYSSVVNILLIVLFVVLMKLGLIGLLLSCFLTQIFSILFMGMRIKIWQHVSIKLFSLSILKGLLGYSAPLIFNLVFVWFLNGYSRFFINWKLGTAANGTFAFGLKFAGILAMFGSVIAMAAIEDAILTFKDDDFIKRFQKNINHIFSLMLQASLVIIPIIGIGYAFISNQDFSDSLNFVPIVVLATIFMNMSTNVGNIFNVFGQTGKIFLTSFIAGLVNVVFSFILVLSLGVLGVAISYMLGALSLLISRYYMGRKIENYSVNIKMLAVLVLTYCVVSVLVIQRLIWLDVMLFIILSMAILYYNRTLVKSTVHKIVKGVKNYVHD